MSSMEDAEYLRGISRFIWWDTMMNHIPFKITESQLVERGLINQQFGR